MYNNIKKGLAVCAMLTGIYASNSALADECYVIGGTVNTVNTSEITQEGTINLVMSGSNGVDTALNGAIKGTITSQSARYVTLSHSMNFPGIGDLNTSGDIAVVTAISADGSVYSVREKINFSNGTGLFENLSASTSNASALGELDFYHNNNSFNVAGKLCFATALPQTRPH